MTLGIISITRYCVIVCGFVDLAISRHPEIGRYHARTQALCALLTGTDRYIYMNAQANTPSVRQTMQNSDNYLKDGHLMLHERHRRPVSDRAPPRSGTHYNMIFNSVSQWLHQTPLCFICISPIQHLPCSSCSSQSPSCNSCASVISCICYLDW